MPSLIHFSCTVLFDANATTRRLAKASTTALRKSGAAVMRHAQNSIKYGGRAKTLFKGLDTLSVSEKRKYFKERQRWIKAGAPKGKRPLPPTRKVAEKQSRPGERPYHHLNYLKKSISFNVNSAAGDVIVGPVLHSNRKGWGVLKALEYGKPSRNFRGELMQVKARPFMRPALEKERNRISKYWKDALNKAV